MLCLIGLQMSVYRGSTDGEKPLSNIRGKVAMELFIGR
jgi:hypothetical protein